MSNSYSSSFNKLNSGQAFDELLITLIWSGDRRAKDRLVKRWQPRLLRAARRLMQDDDQAQTAVQECWISIFSSLHRLKYSARFAPWAFGILHRRCADLIRKSQRRRQLAERLSGGEQSPAAGQEDALAINQAFAKLPSDQRLAAHLHFVEGLTLVEIAEALSMPIGTAKSRLFRARHKLKAALSPSVQFSEGEY